MVRYPYCYHITTLRRYDVTTLRLRLGSRRSGFGLDQRGEDRPELFRVQPGASDDKAVHVRKAGVSGGVLWVHAPRIGNAAGAGGRFRNVLPNRLAQDGVDPLGFVGRAGRRSLAYRYGGWWLGWL